MTRSGTPFANSSLSEPVDDRRRCPTGLLGNGTEKIMFTGWQCFRGAALLAAVAMSASGCDQQRHPAETAGQKVDRAANQVAATTKDVAANAANVVDDAALTAKVKAALFAEPGLKTLQIDVETHDAVVTLAGSVDSDVLHRRAVQIAGSLSGVRQVVDKLVVKAG
jgi:osmotically-inducible protein OsmY